MKLRKFAATAAATVIALSAAPAAQAQNLDDLIGGIGIFDGIATTVIEGASCSDLETVLKEIDKNTEGELLTPTTTRNQLAFNLRDLSKNTGIGTSPLALAAAKYSGQTADKALKCGIVKNDTLLTGGGGALSSMINDYAPALSSTLQGRA